MAKVITLEDLFLDLLKDIYYAEKKILKALPKMARALERGSELAEAFEKHREETEGQVDRLEEVFEIIGQRARGKRCAAIEGISEEADQMIDEVECPATLAAGLLADAQAVEHYEIARYGALVEWTRMLGHDDAAELLEQTLEEEKNTDKLLNELALGGINEAARRVYAGEDEEDEDEEDESPDDDEDEDEDDDEEEDEDEEESRGQSRRRAA